MEGTPRIVPSRAAETVPEYVTSSPRLTPRLIPDTTSAGRPRNSFLTARLTQSVGVPLIENTCLPRCVMRSGLCSVRAWPIAFRSRSGATTQTSPSAFIAAVKACRPGDATPSSLVTRIFTHEPGIKKAARGSSFHSAESRATRCQGSGLIAHYFAYLEHRILAYWRQKNYPLTFDRSERFKRS